MLHLYTPLPQYALGEDEDGGVFHNKIRNIPLIIWIYSSNLKQKLVRIKKKTSIVHKFRYL